MTRQTSQRKRERFPLDALTLDETETKPICRQLEDQIREAIRGARLRPGDRLPSTRNLANDLGIARNTARHAYDQLILEGYLATVRGSGTRVAEHLPEQLTRPPRHVPQNRAARPVRLSTAARRMASLGHLIEGDMDRPARPFRPHTPASDAFPRKLWGQLTTRRLRQMSRGMLERVDPKGYLPLRKAIAGYLRGARGVSCTAEQVVITAGTQQALELISKLLIEPGDTVCMEDPGYTPAAILFELAGAKVVFVPVDEGGLDVAKLDKMAADAKLIYVTPASQFPLGMTMPMSRRLALIEWAERSGALILEDDYNGEYRYAGRPVPALHGLAAPGRVLYTGSFSKLLFPSLRIGYVVVPHEVVAHFAMARWLVDRHSPPLEQATLADFIEHGHFARHLRRMRTLNANRQTALVEAASDHLDGILDVPPSDAGLHLIGWLRKPTTASELLHAASSANVEMMSTAWFAVRRQKRESVILGYAPFTPREIRRAANALARTLSRK